MLRWFARKVRSLQQDTKLKLLTCQMAVPFWYNCFYRAHYIIVYIIILQEVG